MWSCSGSSRRGKPFAQPVRSPKKTRLLAELIDRADPDGSLAIISYLVRGASTGSDRDRLVAGQEVAPGQFAAAAEPSLTIAELHARLDEIAEIKGKGSQARRVEALGAIFARAVDNERRFLVSVFGGEMRQGAQEGLLVDAVAKASSIAATKVRRALMFSGDLIDVARIALTEGEPGIGRFTLELFRPVKPMLAQTSDSVEAAVDELGDTAFEYKMDGARIQVHKLDDEVRESSADASTK